MAVVLIAISIVTAVLGTLFMQEISDTNRFMPTVMCVFMYMTMVISLVLAFLTV